MPNPAFGISDFTGTPVLVWGVSNPSRARFKGQGIVAGSGQTLLSIRTAFGVQGETITGGFWTVYTAAGDLTNPSAPTGLGSGTLSIFDNWGSAVTADVSSSTVTQSRVCYIPFSSALLAALNQAGDGSLFTSQLNFYANFTGADQYCTVNVAGWTVYAKAATAYQDSGGSVHPWYSIRWEGPYGLPSGGYSSTVPGGFVPNPVANQLWTVPSLPGGNGIGYLNVGELKNVRVSNTVPDTSSTIRFLASSWNGFTPLSTGYQRPMPDASDSWLTAGALVSPYAGAVFNPATLSGASLGYLHRLQRAGFGSPDTPISVQWPNEQIYFAYRGALLPGPPRGPGPPVTPPANPGFPGPVGPPPPPDRPPLEPPTPPAPDAEGPFNFYSHLGQFYRVAISNGTVMLWRSDFGAPPFAIGPINVSNGTADKSPGGTVDHRTDRVYVVWSRGGDAYEAHSDDDGGTFGMAMTIITGGTHTTIETGTDGTIIRAAYITGSPGVIKATIQRAGDVNPSAIVTFVDNAGASLTVENQRFHLSQEHRDSDRWLLSCVRSGETSPSEWWSADPDIAYDSGKMSWTRI